MPHSVPILTQSPAAWLSQRQWSAMLRTAELRSSTRTAGSNPTEGERTNANQYGYAEVLMP